ncbi:MAG: ABC transporter permease [Nitrospirae bacterium]|nr:ABC transporter permease [Nitrospirota bacterium]
MVFTDAMKAIAHKEVSDKLKSKWVGVITVGFALFTIIIAYFGTATSGVASFRNMEATIASLTSLVIYFIPLLALTLGGGVIADERDRHNLEFYLASPISVTEFITGKFIGLAIALTLPAVFGFGLSGIVLVAKTGLGSAGSFLIFVVNSVILGIIFLSISFLVSVVFYERSKVIAFTIFLWLFFTILYDMGLVGVLVVTKGILSPKIFSFLLMLNPVDVYRIINFLTIGKYMIFLGMSSVDLPSFIKAPVLWGICLLWIVIPLMSSYYFFKKRYLE